MRTEDFSHYEVLFVPAEMEKLHKCQHITEQENKLGLKKDCKKCT
jgi:hypothetical protein